eukprot:scaffold7151_cov33-Tisochrysis_lutea.AAC.3
MRGLAGGYSLDTTLPSLDEEFEGVIGAPGPVALVGLHTGLESLVDLVSEGRDLEDVGGPRTC